MEVTCPECGAESETFHRDDKRSELVCKKCGLVLRGSYNYVAGWPIQFPFGGKIVDRRQIYDNKDKKTYIS